MSSKKVQNRGLGRGLSALMADVNEASPGPDESSAAQPDMMVPVEKVHPNPNQPRRHFDADSLADLSRSIGEKGIIQPLIVRRNPNRDGEFEIVAGERRWRAAQMARLHEVPVILREMSDTDVLEVAIIENIQRADLNPIEEGLGYQQLIDRFGHTQDQLSKALGKSRSHIANMMRLTGLPDAVKALLSDGSLSMGHARALVPLEAEAATQLANDTVRQGWSVRQLENNLKKPPTKRRTGKAPAAASKDADTRALENDLAAQLRMAVDIEHGADGGSVTIRYSDLDQLDLLCSLLSAG